MKKATGIIVTIEGTDSLIALHTPEISRIRYVICDEVHLVDGFPRGDHLRLVLNRIKEIRERSKKQVNFHIMSATITSPKELANRYFLPNRLIIDKSKKPLELNLENYTKTSIQRLESYMKQNNLRKALIFCNTRKSTEFLTQKIKQNTNYENVYTHHASLSKIQREKVERRMNTIKYGICIATMTLELGIDIGDIDLVVMKAPPPNISSFLQRLGRGCRRRNDRSLVLGWYHNPFEKLLFNLYESLVIEGTLENQLYYPKYSVCVQQLFSIAKQFLEEGITFEYILTVMKSFISYDLLIQILNYVIEQEFFFYRNKKHFSASKLSDRIDKHSIYSNISFSLPFGEIEVRNSINNDILGYVNYSATSKGNCILLGGTEWIVDKFQKNTVYVSPLYQKNISRTFFPPSFVKGHYSYDLAQKIKEYIFSDKSKQLKSELYIMIPPNSKKSGVYLFHFLGSIYGKLFASYLEREGFSSKIHVINGIYIYCKKIEIEKLQFKSIPTEIVTLDEDLDSLKSILSLGPYSEYLPNEVVMANIVESFDPIEFFRIISEFKVEYIPLELVIKMIDLFGLSN